MTKCDIAQNLLVDQTQTLSRSNLTCNTVASEPLTAVDLASNLVQFVGFACKLPGGAVAIYKSSFGASKENAILHITAIDLSSLASKIVASRSIPMSRSRITTVMLLNTATGNRVNRSNYYNMASGLYQYLIRLYSSTPCARS